MISYSCSGVQYNFMRVKLHHYFILACLFTIVISYEFSATISPKHLSSINQEAISSSLNQQPQLKVEDINETEHVLKEPPPENKLTNTLDHDDTYYPTNCDHNCENELGYKQTIAGEYNISHDHIKSTIDDFVHKLLDFINRTMSFIYDFEPYLIKRSKNKLDETYCHIDDLNARFDCLQNNLIDVLRSLSMEESLKLSEGIRLERHGATNTSETERSFGSGLWSSITAFFQRRVLSISVSRFVEGLMPTSVTKARIFEYDESLEQLFDAFFFDSETDTSESRGKKKKRKKFKKAIMIAIMTKAAIAAKAVLAGVVLLAKKALMVSIISLMMSLITAKKKKGKGDDHRRTDYYDDYIEWD